MYEWAIFRFAPSANLRAQFQTRPLIGQNVVAFFVEREDGFEICPINQFNRQPVGSVSGAPDYCAGDRGSIPGRTNTQGLKITEEKVLPL